MGNTKKEIILDYFEYKELKHNANLFDRLKKLADEKDGSYEIICKSTLYHDFEFCFRTREIIDIKKEHNKQIQESSDYIKRLKEENKRLKNRNLIQRILNK